MRCYVLPVTDPMPPPLAIIRKSGTTLRTLPRASEVHLPGHFAWSPISTTALTAALGVDPGAWNTWRNRRLTPDPLPSAWFKRASGSPLVYRVDHILVWLAERRAEQLDTIAAWRHSLCTRLETEASAPAEVRKIAVFYARGTGPVFEDIRFTPAGFRAYLLSLAG